MYTKQGPLFDALTASGFSQMQVSALRDIFAFCQHDLEQRGQLAVLTQRPLGATDGALEVANYPFPPTSQYSSPDSNGNMTNGWGINVLAGGIKNNGPFLGGFRWGKVTANWTNIAGDDSYADVIVASDRTGTYADPYTTVRVYLPRYGTGFDPAVYLDGVIKFEYDLNGVAVGKDYPLNTRIGERKCVDSTSNIPTGWQLADGTNGTLDMRDAYIGGYKAGGTFGTPDGSYGNTGLTITISGNGGTVATSSATTGISIANHSAQPTIDKSAIAGAIDVSTPLLVHTAQPGGPTNTEDEASHTHTVNFSGNDGTASAGSADVDFASGITTSAGSAHSHAILYSSIIAAIEDHAGDLCDIAATSGGTTVSTNAQTLTHSITDSGHTHTVASDTLAATLSVATAGLPHTVAPVWIERVA